MGFNLGNFFNSIGTTAGHAIGVLPKNKHITGVDWKGIDRTVNSIGGAVTIKSYPIKIETTAVRRTQGKLHDADADAFFKDFLPLLPDPPK